MSQNSRDVRIDPFLHNKDKFKKIEKDLKEASNIMKKGIERAKRIDIVGQNGDEGDHYDK